VLALTRKAQTAKDSVSEGLSTRVNALVAQGF
jgi:hypothetical protein